MNYTLLIILGIVSFIQDQLTTNCKNVTVETLVISLFHHLFSCWLFLAPLLGYSNYSFHALAAIVVIISWKIYGVCLWTERYNVLCGINRKNNHRDLIYRIVNITGIKHKILLLCLIFFDILNIFKV